MRDTRRYGYHYADALMRFDGPVRRQGISRYVHKVHKSAIVISQNINGGLYNFNSDRTYIDRVNQGVRGAYGD